MLSIYAVGDAPKRLDVKALCVRLANFMIETFRSLMQRRLQWKLEELYRADKLSDSATRQQLMLLTREHFARAETWYDEVIRSERKG